MWCSRESTYCGLVLDQALIIPADCRNEKEAVHVFETMHPFLSFGSLTTDIEHVVSQRTQVEDCFGDASGTETGAQHILVVGHVVFGE